MKIYFGTRLVMVLLSPDLSINLLKIFIVLADLMIKFVVFTAGASAYLDIAKWEILTLTFQHS